MFPLQNTKSVNVLKQASFTTSQSATGVIDTLGFDEVAVDIWLDTAASTSNVLTVLKLSECDTSNGSYSDIDALTGGTGFTIPTAANTSIAEIYRLNVDCRGKKRWLKPTVTAGNAALIMGVTATLGRAEVASEARSGTGQGMVADG